MSNSKLTAEQKQFRKVFIAVNPDVQFFSFPDMGATVALRETGQTMGEFSVSICSDTEQKFRRKVGEYCAAERMNNGQVLPVKLTDKMEVTAENIAQSISG